jgi:hypothetical protein
MKLANSAAYTWDLLEAVASDVATLEEVARGLEGRMGILLDAERNHRVQDLRGLAGGLADGLHQIAVRLQQQAAEARRPALSRERPKEARLMKPLASGERERSASAVLVRTRQKAGAT